MGHSENGFTEYFVVDQSLANNGQKNEMNVVKTQD